MYIIQGFVRISCVVSTYSTSMNFALARWPRSRDPLRELLRDICWIGFRATAQDVSNKLPLAKQRLAIELPPSGCDGALLREVKLKHCRELVCHVYTLPCYRQ